MIVLVEEILYQLIDSLSHYLQGFIHSRCCRIFSVNSISYHFLCFISFTNCSIETQPLDFHVDSFWEKNIQHPKNPWDMSWENTLFLRHRGTGVTFGGSGVSIGVRILRAPESHGGQKHGNFTFAVGPSVTWHTWWGPREGRQKRSPATSQGLHLKITNWKGKSSSSWWQLKYFLFSSLPAEMIPNLTSIFFKLVETTNYNHPPTWLWVQHVKISLIFQGCILY